MPALGAPTWTLGLRVSLSFSSEALALLVAPLLDFCVVSGEQDIRDRMAAIFWWARVTRRAKAPTKERVGAGAIEVGHGAGKQTHRSVNYRQRGGLPSTQDEIAERYLLRSKMVGDALVDVLVVPAEERELLARRETLGIRMRENPSAR